MDDCNENMKTPIAINSSEKAMETSIKHQSSPKSVSPISKIHSNHIENQSAKEYEDIFEPDLGPYLNGHVDTNQAIDDEFYEDEESEACDSIEGPIESENGKREFRLHEKKKKLNNSSPRKVKWLGSVNDMAEVKLGRTNCCNVQKCFQTVNYDIFTDHS